MEKSEDPTYSKGSFPVSPRAFKHPTSSIGGSINEFTHTQRVDNIQLHIHVVKKLNSEILCCHRVRWSAMTLRC